MSSRGFSGKIQLGEKTETNSLVKMYVRVVDHTPSISRSGASAPIAGASMSVRSSDEVPEAILS